MVTINLNEDAAEFLYLEIDKNIKLLENSTNITATSERDLKYFKIILSEFIAQNPNLNRLLNNQI